jgi:hypothetical protein
MDVSAVEKIQTVNKTVSQEAVQTAKLEDTLSISSDVQKKAEWVEMLKQMPDIRQEKIAAALSSDAFSQHAKILTDVARKIQVLHV